MFSAQKPVCAYAKHHQEQMKVKHIQWINEEVKPLVPRFPALDDFIQFELQ